MRSLPPPIFSFSAYSSSVQCAGSAEVGEGLVERGQVAVSLGVREYAVAVEQQRGHQARPDPPKSAMCSRAVAMTAARW